MTLATIAVNSRITVNEQAPVVDQWGGELGLIEVERTDENDVTVHFRHVDSEVASISADTDRAGAVALAYALLAAAEADG